MSAAHLLEECAAVGITVTLDGEDLRIRAASDADLAAFAPRIRDHKPAIHEVLLKREITDLACGSVKRFDRMHFDALFAAWQERYGATSPTLPRSESIQEGA